MPTNESHVQVGPVQEGPEPAATPASVPSTPTSTVVSVVATRPVSVLEDIDRAMQLAGISQHLSPDLATLLKINISWQHWFPACSTTPWQLDGVIRALRKAGHDDLIGAHNGTVVVDSF